LQSGDNLIIANGINVVSDHALDNAMNEAFGNTAAYRLFELLPMMPRFTVERVRKVLETTFPTANAAVKTLEELGLIGETTGNKKNRSFSYSAYITLLSQ